jgi:hypothetical protein
MRLCWVILVIGKILGLRLNPQSPLELYAKYYKPYIKHLFQTINYPKSFPAVYTMFKCTRLSFAVIYNENVGQDFIAPIVEAFARFPDYLRDTRFRNLMLGNRPVSMADPSLMGPHEEVMQGILQMKPVFLLTKQTDSMKAWGMLEVTAQAIDHLVYMISGNQVSKNDYKMVADALIRITLIIRSLKHYPENQRLLYFKLINLQWKIEERYRFAGESLGLNALFYLYYRIQNPVSQDRLFDIPLKLDDELVREIADYLWDLWIPEKDEEGKDVFRLQRERFMVCQRRMLLLAAYPNLISDTMIEGMCEECMHGLVYDSTFMRYIDHLERKGHAHQALIIERQFLRHAFFNRQIYRLLGDVLSVESAIFRDEILGKSFAGSPGFVSIWFDSMGLPVTDFSLARMRTFFHRMLLVNTRRAWECEDDLERQRTSKAVGDLVLMCFRLRISLEQFIQLCGQTFALDAGPKRTMLRRAIGATFHAANPRSAFKEAEIYLYILKGILYSPNLIINA